MDCNREPPVQFLSYETRPHATDWNRQSPTRGQPITKGTPWNASTGGLADGRNTWGDTRYTRYRGCRPRSGTNERQRRIDLAILQKGPSLSRRGHWLGGTGGITAGLALLSPIRPDASGRPGRCYPLLICSSRSALARSAKLARLRTSIIFPWASSQIACAEHILSRLHSPSAIRQIFR